MFFGIYVYNIVLIFIHIVFLIAGVSEAETLHSLLEMPIFTGARCCVHGTVPCRKPMTCGCAMHCKCLKPCWKRPLWKVGPGWVMVKTLRTKLVRVSDEHWLVCVCVCEEEKKWNSKISSWNRSQCCRFAVSGKSWSPGLEEPTCRFRTQGETVFFWHRYGWFYLHNDLLNIRVARSFI